MKNLKYLIDHIVYQILHIFKTIYSMSKMADNSPTRIYVNKIKNKITFEIKTGHHLYLSTLLKR